MSKQMTKKDAVSLLALLTFIAVSKNGEQVIEDIGLSQETTDKMMRVLVSSFDNDEIKANKFIVKEVNKLLAKLADHEVDECQRKNFKTGDEE